jgi:hypothetical protein
MATSHLSPQLRPAEHDAGAVPTLIVLALVLANIFLLMALSS